MKQTSNYMAATANINILSNLTQKDLQSIMDTVRSKELRGYSKSQQDDFLGDAILHLCEVASTGYFKNVNDKSLHALTFTVLKRKAGDCRDKSNTFIKHVDIVRQDISDMYGCGFDPAEDEDDFEDAKFALHQAVNALTGKEADVMRMSLDGYSDDEIMANLGMTRNFVQKSRSIAKSKVVKAMKTMGYGRDSGSSETRLSAGADASADFFCPKVRITVSLRYYM